MKKLIALGIVAILLVGLTGLVMAKCVTVTPKTLTLDSEGLFKVTIQDEGIEEDINPDTVECEGADVVKSKLARKGDKLMLWFETEDLDGVIPGDEVVLTLTGEFYDGDDFTLNTEPIRVIDSE